MNATKSRDNIGRNPQFPDRTVEEAARAAGASVQVMWQVKGPKDTAIKFMECLLINHTVCIVQTFETGGWDVLTSGRSGRIDDTIIDVFKRCDVKVPKKFAVMKDGKQFGNWTAPTVERAIELAEQTGGKGRYSAIEVA